MYNVLVLSLTYKSIFNKLPNPSPSPSHIPIV